MKPIIIGIVLLLSSQTCIAQLKALKVVQDDSKKEIIFKNKRRVKIKTVDGRMIRGKLSIKKNRIYLNNLFVKLEDIAMIKKDPLLVYILSSAFLIYTGASTAGIAFIMGVLVDSSAFLLAIPAAAIFYIGLKAPNFSKRHNLNNHKKLEIIELPIEP